MGLILSLLISCTPQDATLTKASYHAWLASGSSATLDEVRRSCNDGRDNDGDGKTDSDDPDCQGPYPTAADLHACSDGVDNDNDEGSSGGGTDEDDVDCNRGLGELGFLKLGGKDDSPTKVLNCTADAELAGECPEAWEDAEPSYFSWLDSDVYVVSQGSLNNPWRTEAILTAEGDLQVTVHQDLGDGYDFRFAFVVDPDFHPSVCIQEGQTCYSGQDDDGDGWVDQEDPDCLYGSWEIGFSSAQCNNGFDDDGDGLADGLDDDCPHAHADAEQTLDPTCADLDDDGEALDNDGDGWANDADPDCAEPGHAEDGEYNSLFACSDGIDNDGDGDIDADDTACANARDNTEDGPNGKYRCNDDYDNDGDGWVDDDDPDCAIYDAEGGLGTTACNDGLDNDGDGFADWEDVDCLTGADASEEATDSTCADEEDNDEDGWIDTEDPDCLFGGSEDGAFGGLFLCNDGEDNVDEDGQLDGKIDVDDRDCKSALDNVEHRLASGSCQDGVDNDGDGYSDDADPDCAFGNSEEGFRTFACNDGQDNDSDGLTDAEDPECGTAWNATEATLGADCGDGLDNDGDGWTDLEDSGCLMGESESGGVDTECSNLDDEDLDGVVNADDPECLSSMDLVEASLDNCADGLDNDGDGWLDDEDPDCQNGIVAHERGFTETACNDGLNNDGDEDSLVDAEDVVACSTASGTTEFDVDQCTDGVDNDQDGWEDNKDPDCTLGVSESGTLTTAQCNDGVDNDGDGLADILDPDCKSGWDNIEEADDTSGQPIPYEVDAASALEQWSADEDGQTIYYLNAGSYQTNPSDENEFWSLPREWLSGYGIAKFGAEEFDVLNNDFSYVGVDATSPSDAQYAAAVSSEVASADAQQHELYDFGLMDKDDFEFKVEGNEWRPIDLATAGLDNWIERHHSWVRLDNTSKVEVDGKVSGDFQIFLAGFESASYLVVRGNFNVASLQEDRWGYPVLEDEIRERNKTEACEF